MLYKPVSIQTILKAHIFSNINFRELKYCGIFRVFIFVNVGFWHDTMTMEKMNLLYIEWISMNLLYGILRVFLLTVQHKLIYYLE